MGENKRRAAKDAVYEQLARVGAALASPIRLELLDQLAQGRFSVEQLAELVGQSLATTSHHLRQLRAAGLVQRERRGTYAWYGLADDQVGELHRVLRAVAEERLAELERIKRDLFDGAGPLEHVERDDLIERVRRGDVMIIDVRPAREFEAGHLRGALSVPIDELERRLGELDQDREIVAYCRGPYCVFAAEAVTVLEREGYRARRLDQGVVEFRALGLAVEEGAA